MKAFNQLARHAVAKQCVALVATRALGTAPSATGGKLSAAQLGEMAVKGIRPCEVQAAKQYASLPQVEESLVRVTLVDFKGEQYKIIGKVGDSLMEAAARYGTSVPLEDDSSGGGVTNQVIRSERWLEDQYGEGPSSWASHVVIPKEWMEKIPAPLGGEKEILSLIDAEDITPTSRLATEIRLTKDLDGLTVYVPDPPPNDDVITSFTL